MQSKLLYSNQRYLYKQVVFNTAGQINYSFKIVHLKHGLASPMHQWCLVIIISLLRRLTIRLQLICM